MVELDREANNGFAAESERGGEEGSFESADESAVFAYLDDTILAVPPQLADAAFNAAIEIIAQAGHVQPRPAWFEA